MKIVILLGMLCSALLVGCGNRDDQSFYEYCAAKEALAKEALVKEALVEEALAADVKSAKVELAKVKSVIYRWYDGELRCPKCRYSRDIDRIELEKTGFYRILRAKVYVKCPEHGSILSEVSEWHDSDDSVERVRTVK